jgi:RHS repeat-associated protein
MNLVDRVNRERSLTAISRTLRYGRIVANASVPTSTYSYDANGNLVQAGGWSYMWDYLNRMLASGFNNSTTTYAYDQSGTRVLQTSTTSTTYYPNKYYSLTSTKSGTNTYATSTNYVFNGDTLLATIDQALYNGAATGSPVTRYIHPDHLGSTNVVTDQNGSLVQLLDYYPYGATRVSTSSYPTNEKRQYIDQFSDAQTGLNYLNARYYSPTQGQFLSEDPVFLSVGNPNQVQQFTGETARTYLSDPQQLNSYNYSHDNPILNKDPSGNAFVVDDAAGFFAGGFVGVATQGVTSYVTGQPMTLGQAAGAFLTGGIIGWGAVNTPETLGVSNAISASVTTGLIGGFYGNLTQQEIDMRTGRQKGGLNVSDLSNSALTTAGTNGVLQALPLDAKISGYTSGRGNMYSTSQGLLTKSANGTINNISIGSGVKSAIGSQALDLYRTVIGLLTQMVTTLQQSNNKK